MNPAMGANHVFTHMNNVFPHQPYNIQAFPTFLPATNMAAQGYPFGAGATHAVNGVDPTAITGLSFLPAVPDATNGPMLHTYVPRNDTPGQNIVYMQHLQGQQQAVYTTVSAPPYQQAQPLFYLPAISPSFTSCLHLSPHPQYCYASASFSSV